jgi:tetratricopeptide (TPR) repeat protein/ADP-heptose:LPS heptosyltransferase
MADGATADALYREARSRCQQGRIAEGIDLVRRALTLDAGQARFHTLLGMALSNIGRHAEALASFDQAIALGAADAHGSRADALVALGRLAEAVESFDRALAHDPSSVADWCNRGAALIDLGRATEAAESFARATSLAPDFAEAHYNHGNALTKLERHADAVASYDRALALKPGYVDALNNRANALNQLGRLPEALAGVEAALALAPEHNGALVTRGVLLRKLRRSAEALASCERALTLRPDDTDVLTVRADLLTDLERFQQAIATLDRIITLKPDALAAKWNKSLICLGLGRFEEGWPLYELRWAGAKGLVPRGYAQPRWNGGAVDGTLLVWGEQGLGDEILHASMLPDVLARTPSVVFEVEPRLAPLFARSFPAIKVIACQPELYAGKVDAQEPLASLGHVLRRSFEEFPRRERGYLVADAARALALRARLANDGRRVIGLSWVSKAPVGGASKSARLADFEALLRLPGCRFVDLQYGDTGEERAALARDLGLTVERLGDIDNTNDLDGLAALMAACDAVITVSNTTAHLAGALGRPTFVMVPHGYARIWYWFHDRNQSPWYPRVAVRRQQSGQPWADVVAAVAREVSALLDSTPSKGSGVRA